MDPKLSGLDPKLQDAYSRVMNGPSTLPGQTPAPAAPNQPPAPAQPNINHPTQATHINPPQPANPTLEPSLPTGFPNSPESTPPSSVGFEPPAAAPTLGLEHELPNTPFPSPVNEPSLHPDPTPAINSTVAFNANNSSVTTTAPGEKPKKSVLPVVIGIFIPIFLVVYAIVWMVIFDVKLPFIGG